MIQGRVAFFSYLYSFYPWWKNSFLEQNFVSKKINLGLRFQAFQSLYRPQPPNLVHMAHVQKKE